MAITEQQQHRIDGIVKHMNDFLDKRFAQARRINPKVGIVEGDVRWHQLETLRQVLAGTKGYGPQRIMVGDILSSSDEAKKRDLFDAVNQNSIQNEVIPQEDAKTAAASQKRSGQLEIRDVKSFYKALDPSLEKVVVLLQTWIWWDMRDAADLYRFDVQIARLRDLREGQLDEKMAAYYRVEMRTRPGADLTKHDVLSFELKRTQDIVDAYRERRQEEHSYQVIVVSQECEGSAESDALCVRLAKRLMGIEKIKSQKGDLDASVKQYYSTQLGLAPDMTTREAILEFEERQAARERETLSEHLSSASRLGESANYKATNLDAMEVRLNTLYTALNIAKPTPRVAAPASKEDDAPAAQGNGSQLSEQAAPQMAQAASQAAQPAKEEFQIPNF